MKYHLTKRDRALSFEANIRSFGASMNEKNKYSQKFSHSVIVAELYLKNEDIIYDNVERLIREVFH